MSRPIEVSDLDSVAKHFQSRADPGAVGVVHGRSCWVLIDEYGAMCGVELPDGTKVPGVRGIEASAFVDDVQVAKVEMFVRFKLVAK